MSNMRGLEASSGDDVDRYRAGGGGGAREPRRRFRRGTLVGIAVVAAATVFGVMACHSAREKTLVDAARGTWDCAWNGGSEDYDEPENAVLEVGDGTWTLSLESVSVRGPWSVDALGRLQYEMHERSQNGGDWEPYSGGPYTMEHLPRLVPEQLSGAVAEPGWDPLDVDVQVSSGDNHVAVTSSKGDTIACDRRT